MVIILLYLLISFITFLIAIEKEGKTSWAYFILSIAWIYIATYAAISRGY